VTDAIVFLLERMGDVSGALLLILEAIQERVKSLSTGVSSILFLKKRNK
jgi:hypothetical protein